MKSRNLARCAIAVGVLALCGWLSFPVLGIPVTMQSFGVLFALFYLGGKWGTAAICGYLCLGVMGVPVFSGLGAGPGVLFGPTGGYLWGFALGGLLYWGLVLAFGEKSSLFAGIFCVVLYYLCGIVWFLVGFNQGTGLWQSLLITVVPFVLPDAAKLLLAYTLSQRLRRIF